MSCLYNKLLYIKHPKVYRKRIMLSKVNKNELDKNIFGFAVKSRRLYGKYPFCNNPNIVLHNEKYIDKNIKSNLDKIGFFNVDILWISNPKQFWLINVVNYKRLIVRIPDDFSQFGVFPKGIELIEKALIEKADLVFVTAKNLINNVEKYGKKAYLLPNGCEINHFLNCNSLNPFNEFNKKRLIYVGAIGKWFDLDLIKYLANKNKDVDICIIGKPQIDISCLEKYDNVKILGAKPYSEIPAYIKNSDIAIIPFINNEFTDRINPIKLFEYFACGIPVVTSNMLEVKLMDSPAYVAKDKYEFSNIVRHILKNNIRETERYIDFAKNNSWNARFEYINKVMKSL